MSGQKAVTPSPDRLAQSVRAIKRRGPAPVHLWSPEFSGDMDIRIARDGTWYHEGSPIRREALVRLFASILKKEGDRYFLVTPVEKFGIVVEDAPFLATDIGVDGNGTAQSVWFETNVGDRITAGPDNPIRVTLDPASGAPSPYVELRGGLEALIDRKSFYRLVDLGTEHDGWFGVWSGGVFFPLMDAADLNAT